ncbi:MAG: hypothetical protein SangKO_057770 [Sandaracinaceae bacterium]
MGCLRWGTDPECCWRCGSRIGSDWPDVVQEEAWSPHRSAVEGQPFDAIERHVEDHRGIPAASTPENGAQASGWTPRTIARSHDASASPGVPR